MHVVNNSPRALFVAIIPLAAVEALMLTWALMGAYAAGQADTLSSDQILLFYAGRLATDGALLFAGHWLLRQSAISSRRAYALMGGAMAAVSYAFAVRNSIELYPPGRGAILTVGLIPTLAGMIAGFVYGQFAGLAPAPRAPARTGASQPPPLTFDGPTRVRSSLGGIVIAALVPAVLTTVLFFTVMSLLLPAYLTMVPGSIFAAAIPAQMFLAMLSITIVPAVIFMLCLHHIARALHRNGAMDYAVIGGALAAICSVLFGPFVPVASIFYLFAPAMIYGAIMGALYRRFAGLEPVPLPEAIIATDTKALVGADHPSRHQHSVILGN
jgi:hypothetical protein